MATLTPAQALKKALEQQATTGAKGPVDPNYVKTLETGQDNNYTQNILDANPKPTITKAPSYLDEQVWNPDNDTVKETSGAIARPLPNTTNATSQPFAQSTVAEPKVGDTKTNAMGIKIVYQGNGMWGTDQGTQPTQNTTGQYKIGDTIKGANGEDWVLWSEGTWIPKSIIPTGQQLPTPTVTRPDQNRNPNPTNADRTVGGQITPEGSALVNAIKKRVAEAKLAQQQMISKAPQTYDPMRAQSEVQKAQQLTSVLEQSANMGDRGGVGRQQALTTQTEGANRLNAIDLQQQNFIDSANAEIARLESNGKYDEAIAVAEAAQRELDRQREDARMAQQIALQREGWARDDARYAQESALEKQRYEQEMALNQQRYDQGLLTQAEERAFEKAKYEQALKLSEQDRLLEQQRYNQGLAIDTQQTTDQRIQNALKNEISTIGQYSNNFQAEIDRRRATPDTADDALIPYLASARQDKINQLGLNQQGQAIQQAPQVTELTQPTAMQLWKQLGTANEAIARALGIAVGTRYGGTSTGSKTTTKKSSGGVDYNDILSQM